MAKIKRGAGVVAGLAEAVSRVFSTPQLQSHLWRNTPTPQPEQSRGASRALASPSCLVEDRTEAEFKRPQVRGSHASTASPGPAATAHHSL